MSAVPSISLAASGPAPEQILSACPAVSEFALREYTAAIFGGSVAVRVETDPEFGDQHLVAEVIGRGSVDEVAARFDQWHRRLRQEFGTQATHYRLALLAE